MRFLKKLYQIFSSSCMVVLIASLPASTTYEMRDYGFGAGGSSVLNSNNYSAIGIVGEQGSTDKNVGTTYNLGPGLLFAQQSNVPAAPTFTNVSSNYNKLKFVINTGSNPTDTLFAIAISTDNFVTTNFVQADDTISSTAVYQTYANWGSSTGEYVIGLSTNTAYKIKVKAVQTKYTESEYSAVGSATTSTPSLSFDIDVSPTDSESGSPYTVAFGTLAIGSVTTAADKVWVDLDTNAEGGGFVYVYSQGTGLSSAKASYTITSASANLTGVSEGYGARINTVTQSAGGPLAAVSPYDGASENVGILNSTSRNILSSTSAPITAGRASILLKAKASTLTPSATDYTGTITMIASASF